MCSCNWLLLVRNLILNPAVLIMGYEYTQTLLLLQPCWEIIPTALKDIWLQCKTKERILSYECIKGDVHAAELKPRQSIEAQINLNDNNILVTVRSAANDVHCETRARSDTAFSICTTVVKHMPWLWQPLL